MKHPIIAIVEILLTDPRIDLRIRTITNPGPKTFQVQAAFTHDGKRWATVWGLSERIALASYAPTHEAECWARGVLHKTAVLLGPAQS